MNRLAIILGLCCPLLGCGGDSSPSTPTVQPANLVTTGAGVQKNCVDRNCTLVASIQNTGTGCASGSAVVARLYDSLDAQVGSDMPMVATGELLASKTIRPNDVVVLKSVGYVDSIMILGTTYRPLSTWTNAPCP